jgi:hypothetical protein
MTALLAFLLLQISTPGEPPGQVECPDGRISHVFVDNHSIFDPAALPEDTRIRWAYTLANRVHMRTREAFIRNELLVAEGDCFDDELVEESARVLREFRFIAGADAFGVEQPDGTHHVVVDTHDEWTTKLGLSVRFDDGLRFEGGFLVEENLLGRGIALGAFYTQRDERRDIGGMLEVPRIRHSSWDGRLSGAATRIGEVLEQDVIHPFRGERPGVAFRQSVRHRNDLFSYLLPENGEASHVVIPVEEQRAEFTLARRFGVAGDLRLLGGGLSYERVNPGSAGRAEAVPDGRYEDRTPASPDLQAPLEPHLSERQAVRANLMAGVRRIRFVERYGLDPVRGRQDLPMGREAILTLGRSLGSIGEGRPPDLHARLDLFRGVEVGPVLTFVSASAEGRRLEGTVGESRWRDMLGDVRSLAYWQPREGAAPTVVLRVAGQAGWKTDAPFQMTLGGPDGVRGYSELQHPGARRALGSLETRWLLPNPFPDFLDLGSTLFVDVGRMWAGDVPYGQDSGWRTAAGGGLRLGFPAGSSRPIRVDLAFPLDAGVSRGPMLRISAREWIGMLEDTRNLEFLRSRRSGITPDFTGVAQDRRPPG